MRDTYYMDVEIVSPQRRSEVSETQSHAFTHLTFALSFGLCACNFFRAISLGPGTCLKPTSNAQWKSVGYSRVARPTSRVTSQIIEDFELASEGRLNGCVRSLANLSDQNIVECAISA